MQNVGNISFRANSSGPKKSANSSCVNINTSAANSDNKKENRSKIANLIAGFFTGAFINKTITNMPGNFIFPEIFSKIDRLNKNLSKNEIQQIEETASKAIKTSELSKKGVEIIKASPGNENLIQRIMTYEVNNGNFKFFPRSYKRNLSDLYTSLVLKGQNTYYTITNKKIVLPENDLQLAVFHEIGHAMNGNLSKIGKILQKSRSSILLAFPILVIALLKNKKSPEEKPKNKLDKITTFIKNNAGKLTFATFIPLLIEEGLASIKGNAIAKQFLSPELAKKVVKYNGVALLSYLTSAIFSGVGIYLGNKARDAALKEGYFAKNQDKN